MNKKALEQRISELERLLADAVRFIAYAQSKGVHGGEAIAKEIEENLNQGEP